MISNNIQGEPQRAYDVIVIFFRLQVMFFDRFDDCPGSAIYKGISVSTYKVIHNELMTSLTFFLNFKICFMIPLEVYFTKVYRIYVAIFI